MRDTQSKPIKPWELLIVIALAGAAVLGMIFIIATYGE